jgi:hypothetical protein
MTAVEWLENQMKTSKYYYKIMEDINSRNTVAQSNILEQAKEMEKQQIKKAFLKNDNSISITDALENFEQYYNQTFKSK